jgi:hypothetical protein
MSKSVTTGLVVAAILSWLAPPAAAQRGGVSIQQALDRPITLNISSAVIGDVFKKLTEASGVKFAVPDEALDALPYGDQTRMRVNLDNITLRKALTPMLAPQALQWTIEEDSVRILPSEALYRMCRRPSYEELQVLGALHAVTLQPPDKGGDVLVQLRKLTEDKELKIAFHPTGDREAALKRAERALPATPAQYLDMLCHGQGWTWYLSGDEIVIVDRTRQIERQLQRRVSLQYQGAKIVNVLDDMCRKGRLQLEMDPGVLSLLPADMQSNFNLLMTDATIAQALQVIAGVTGLKFTRTSEGIRVEASEALTKRAESQPARKRPPFFVKMTLPSAGGVGMEVYWTPDELPDDLIDAIQDQKGEFMKQLRESLNKAKAATRPGK